MIVSWRKDLSENLWVDRRIVIHLSTFVDCQFLAKLKPSQISLMKALSECESDVLEVLFQPTPTLIGHSS